MRSSLFKSGWIKEALLARSTTARANLLFSLARREWTMKWKRMRTLLLSRRNSKKLALSRHDCLFVVKIQPGFATDVAGASTACVKVLRVLRNV